MSEEKFKYVYMNGDFVPKNKAHVSIFDMGFLYGDGLFESVNTYNSKTFKLDEHIDRLYRSAQSLNIKVPLEKAELKEVVLTLVEKNALKNSFTKIVVTRGVITRSARATRAKGLFERVAKPTIVIFNIPLEKHEEQGLKLIISGMRRIPPECLDPKIKSLNYLNIILPNIEAASAGAHGAIMLDIRGFVAEAAGANLFIVRNGKVFTPPTENCLEGITRSIVMEIAKKSGFEVIERKLTMHELYNADEMFLTGTSEEIGPVIEIDGRTIGTGKPGPVTKQLIRLYNEMKRK